MPPPMVKRPVQNLLAGLSTAKRPSLRGNRSSKLSAGRVPDTRRTSDEYATGRSAKRRNRQSQARYRASFDGIRAVAFDFGGCDGRRLDRGILCLLHLNSL